MDETYIWQHKRCESCGKGRCCLTKETLSFAVWATKDRLEKWARSRFSFQHEAKSRVVPTAFNYTVTAVGARSA